VNGEAGVNDLARESWSLAQEYTVERMADDYLGWYEALAQPGSARRGGPPDSARRVTQPKEAA
jgi:hypothetical protein